MSLHSGLFPLKLSSTLIPCTSQVQFEARENRRIIGADGAPAATAVRVLSAAPRFTTTSLAIGTLLTLHPQGAAGTGFEWAPVADHTACEWYEAAPNAGKPGYAANGNKHALAASCKARSVIDSIRWSQSSRAVEVALSAYLLSNNGTANPKADAVSAALPANPIGDETWGLTSLALGALDLTPSVTSLDLSIDPKVDTVDAGCYKAALPFPVETTRIGPHGHLEAVAAIDTTDLSSTIPTGNLVATFTQHSDVGPGFTATTKSVTMAGAVARVESFGGSHGQPLVRRIWVMALWDGTTLPLAW